MDKKTLMIAIPDEQIDKMLDVFADPESLKSTHFDCFRLGVRYAEEQAEKQAVYKKACEGMRTGKQEQAANKFDPLFDHPSDCPGCELCKVEKPSDKGTDNDLRRHIDWVRDGLNERIKALEKKHSDLNAWVTAMQTDQNSVTGLENRIYADISNLKIQCTANKNNIRKLENDLRHNPSGCQCDTGQKEQLPNPPPRPANETLMEGSDKRVKIEDEKTDHHNTTGYGPDGPLGLLYDWAGEHFGGVIERLERREFRKHTDLLDKAEAVAIAVLDEIRSKKIKVDSSSHHKV